MRRRITSIMLCFTLLCTGMVGCGSPNVESSIRSETEKTLKGIQKFDSDVLKVLEDEDPDQDLSFSNVEQNQKMLDYLKESAEKMTYEIKDVDEEKLTVKVECTYVDSFEFVQNLYSNMLSWAVLNMDSDEDVSEKEANTIVNQALADVSEETMATEEVVFEYKEDGKGYTLKEVPENLYNVATAGVYGYFNEAASSFDDEDATDSSEYDAVADYIETKVIKIEGGSVLEVTNSGELDAQVKLDLIFKDKNGKMVYENSEYIDCLQAGDMKTIGSYCYGDDFSTVDIQVTTTQPYAAYYYDYDLEKDETKDDILLKYTNTGDVEISDISAYVVFYKDGKEIGYSTAYDGGIKPGKYSCVTASKPYDYNKSENIKYDNYKVFTYAYQMVD